jgi:dual specificity tyrosine-phosphorylation-regulated kinase 2/3/4
MRESDPDDLKNIIRMKNYFSYRNHICITFELVSINLYEFLRLNSFKGLSLPLIKCFARQILNALEYTRTLQIVHCDLKPENVLLINPKKAGIKLIDFGSSCFISERLHTYIQSRFYRAPEIMLGIPYTPAIDMWSLGCILAELYTGQPLWPGESEKDQFLYIVSFLGMPPPEMLLNACRKNLFIEGGQLKSCQLSDGKDIFPGMHSLQVSLKTSDNDFLDFLMRCFEWNPEKRLTPTEALNHPWSLIPKPSKSNFLDKKLKKK